jgi:OmcA/MtrC family decaheme c-type cytochrome
MCHNPRTTDANSGNVLTMQTMTHKIHAGRLLQAKKDANLGGETYVIWGFNASKADYSEVGFPQDLRNCNVCHSASNPKTPQGDNWKSRTTKESCLTCHASGTNSSFVTSHASFALAILGPGGLPGNIPNAKCQECHEPGKAVSPERVHWNQNEENSAKYKVVIDSTSYDATARKVTVKYSVVDPTNGNRPYNLITPDCTAPAPNVCAVPENPSDPRSAFKTRFGNLRFYLAYPNLVGQPQTTTEFTSYNNGGSSANAYLYLGANDGSNRYTIDISVPADSANAAAAGTARVVGIGQIKEPKLQVQVAQDPRPPVTPTTLINVVAQHTSADVVLSGASNPRRQVVSNDKCNVCHGALGTTSGSNTLADAFHGGARNTVEACVLCHDQNRFSSTVMTNGRALSENYSFKRMIHGIHGNSKRVNPFTHGNNVIGNFDIKTFKLTANGFVSGTAATAPLGTALLPFATTTPVAVGTPLATGVENYAAEVRYPAVGLNCNACHVNNSWANDRTPIGTAVAKPLVGSATPLTTDPNPLNGLVISPRAASCTACHDSSRAIDHVIQAGGSSFGTMAQGTLLTSPRETCDDCHAVGQRLGVDAVHGQTVR